MSIPRPQFKMQWHCLLVLFSMTAVLLPMGNLRAQRLYSIADLHGDYDMFKTIISRSGLATFEGDTVRWTGDNSILVSLGDIVDRGPNSRPIYLAFQQLARQAKEQGGEVVNILGNHELLNLAGDLTHVPREELSASGDYGGEESRAAEWNPAGIIGGFIRERFVAVAVRHRTLFLHGGLDPDYLLQHGHDATAIDSLNKMVSNLLQEDDSNAYSHEVFSPLGPVRNRYFAHENDENKVCEKVERTLKMIGADRMVIGHTRQLNGSVNSRCPGIAGPQIILSDTSISGSFDENRPSLIEINGPEAAALYFSKRNSNTKRVSLASSLVDV